MKAKPRRQRGTGSCYQKIIKNAAGKKTKSKYWTIQFFRDGRRVREATRKTEWAEAQMLLRKRLVEIDKGEHILRKGKPARFAELFEDLLVYIRLECPKSEKDARGRWKRLEPVFGKMQVSSLTNSDITRYKLLRKKSDAYNGTINRELGTIRQMLNLGVTNGRIVKGNVLNIPMLNEKASIRRGFLDDATFCKLVAVISDAWLRTFVEIAYTYGARATELLTLRVQAVNLEARTLTFYWTKNEDPRLLVMTKKVEELLRLAVEGKKPTDFVFTRDNSKPVKGFSRLWRTVTTAAGLGWWRCKVESCKLPWTGKACECGSRKRQWSLLVHDFRRSAATNLASAGVSERTGMEIGGWKTNSIYKRYQINNQADQRAAMEKLEELRAKRTAPVIAPATPETSGEEARGTVQ